MKIKVLVAALLFTAVTLTSCKKDDDDCQTCKIVLLADIDVCKGDDGNAIVDGDATNTTYESYIADLESIGYRCN